jgi:hypothetical protein
MTEGGRKKMKKTKIRGMKVMTKEMIMINKERENEAKMVSVGL